MGVVHKALDTRTGETVAVKFLQDDKARDGSVLDRLIHEVGLVRKLDHPSICKVFCLQAHEGRPFVAMEALRGPDLSKYMKDRGGRLPLDEVLKIMAPVAEALDLAHSQGVIHLDLKPHNLKFRRPPDLAGQLVILDFGLARPRGDLARTTGPVRLGGSRAYRPPEQSVAGTPRPTHDIYAFAVTVYELLSGAPPHLGPDLEVRKASGEVPPIPGYDRRLMAVFVRALSPRASDRPTSVQAFLQELEDSRNASPLSWILFLLVGLIAAAAWWRFG
jgi:serine/threonine-protein kinase